MLASASSVGTRVVFVHVCPDFLQEIVGLGQVFAIGTFALEEVGYRIEPEAVDARFAPVVQNLENFFLHQRAIVVEVGLVVEKAVPVVLLRHGIPGPVGSFGIRKNNPHILILVGIVSPDVVLPLGRSFGGPPRPLKPRVLVGGVVDNQFDNNFQISVVGFFDECLQLLNVAVGRIDAVIVSNVVAVVAQRRGVERQQPDGRHAEVFEVVQLFHDALEITDAIAVAVAKGLDVEFVYNGIFVPMQIVVYEWGVLLSHVVNDE